VRLDRPLGLQKAEAPRISRQSAHEGGKVVSTTNRPPLPPGDIISVRDWVNPPTPGAIMRPIGLSELKNSNDLIGNRTRDLPACSAVPQPTAPPRADSVGVSRPPLSAENRVQSQASPCGSYGGESCTATSFSQGTSSFLLSASFWQYFIIIRHRRYMTVATNQNTYRNPLKRDDFPSVLNKVIRSALPVDVIFVLSLTSCIPH